MTKQITLADLHPEGKSSMVVTRMIVAKNFNTYYAPYKRNVVFVTRIPDGREAATMEGYYSDDRITALRDLFAGSDVQIQEQDGAVVVFAAPNGFNK